MFQFNQSYLRVSKPVTTDGINLKLDDEGKRVMKITHMPLTAEPYLKKRNEKLPDNLKMIIERVEPPQYSQPQAVVNTEVEQLKMLLAQAEAEKEKLLQKVAQIPVESDPGEPEAKQKKKTVTNETA